MVISPLYIRTGSLPNSSSVSGVSVSYNLNSLDIPSETKGIKLKLNSEENGEVEVTFDLKTAGSNEKLTTNVDLSNMQLKKKEFARVYS